MNKKSTNKHRNKSLSGVALALAMASLSGCTLLAQYSATNNSKEKTDLVHCYGVNKCNGHNACKTENNSCKGHSSCHGMGFVVMPSKACADVGGSVKDDWVGEIEKTELVHCFGVNTCKGHNECKTSKNSCKGHAECKATGFVDTPAAACENIGGRRKD